MGAIADGLLQNLSPFMHLLKTIALYVLTFLPVRLGKWLGCS